MWVRGLKLWVKMFVLNLSVAPHVGAWIETRNMPFLMHKEIQSHLMWVRGLKLSLSGR